MRIRFIVCAACGLFGVLSLAGQVRESTGRDAAAMVLVPSGEFLMGSPDGRGNADEHPRHAVYLDAYCIDRCPVTVKQYRRFCGATGRSMPEAPAWGWQDDHPVVNVTWDDAKAYAEFYGKRLPTEAEWEKACRAGSTESYCFGDDAQRLAEYAWYFGNAHGQTHPVGTMRPNAWQLFDMHGNVWEWCADIYDAGYYRTGPAKNPQGPATGKLRVLRGGSWGNPEENCRSAYRGASDPTVFGTYRGFRCAAAPH
jgi:formylglycine-generating enzyme required for sulfatase activity